MLTAARYHSHYTHCEFVGRPRTIGIDFNYSFKDR
jgi:hypothetical protein